MISESLSDINGLPVHNYLHSVIQGMIRLLGKKKNTVVLTFWLQ